MKTIVVESPTLDIYLQRVKGMAARHLGDEEKWFSLSEEDIADKDERDEFSFIKVAVWDKLMEKDFFAVWPPLRKPSTEKCSIVEPGLSPGSTLLDGLFWTRTITLNSLTAF